MDVSNRPLRMLYPVADQFSTTGYAETTASFFEWIGTGIGGKNRLLRAGHLDVSHCSVVAPMVLYSEKVVALAHRVARHVDRGVGFVVAEASHQRDDTARNELPDEQHPELIVIPDISSQVEFRKIDEPGNPATTHPRILKIECNEAHMGLVLPPIESECGMKVGAEDLIGDGEGQQDQIGPPRPEKDAASFGVPSGISGCGHVPFQVLLPVQDPRTLAIVVPRDR